jgi:ribosomal protein L37AE/L43A
MAVGIAGVFGGGYLVIRTDLPSAVGIGIAFVGLLVFAFGSIYSYAVYRCPTCDGSLIDFNGINFNIAACWHCGASFE